MGPLCGGAAGRLLRVAGAGAGRRLLLLSAARSSGSPAGGNPAVRREALAVKKRGYDITRNPHLNKAGQTLICHLQSILLRRDMADLYALVCTC